MIVPYQEIMEFAGVADSQVLESTHKGVEEEVKSWMDWEPESVVHTGKLYDGNGFPSLFLDELHIQRVMRVASQAAGAISIKNTSTDASNAHVEVTSEGVRLVVADGANEDDTLTLFADYATITLMVDQLNTIGKGWSVEIEDSDFESYSSTALLETDGFYVGSFDGTTAQFDSLVIAGAPIQCIVYKERGELKRKSGTFPAGSLNIAINYVSGWALADMPADLQHGIKRLVKQTYARDRDDTTGLKSYSVDGVTEVFDTGATTSSTAVNDIDNLIPYKYKKVG